MGGHFSKMEKVSIFIDGNNLYHGLKYIYKNSKKLINFNFEKFCNFLAKDKKIVEIFYYNASLDKIKNLDKYKSQKKFFDKLKKIPNLNLRLCKLLKRKIKGTNQDYYVLKEDDIHMAVDMVEGAFNSKFDVTIVVLGDGDFVPTVKAVQRKNKVVKNVYFKNSSSRNLKQHCDESLELNKKVLDEFFD